MTEKSSTDRSDNPDTMAGRAAFLAYLARYVEGPGRNMATELRFWLTIRTGQMVDRRHAEELVDFLKRSGWKEPVNV